MAGVTSSYPAALDSESNLTPPNNGDTLSVADHWLAGNAGPIVAIETELGTDPAGYATDVKTRLSDINPSEGNLNLDAGYGSKAPIYGVRAWVKFSGTTISESANVSSVTSSSTGQYYVNFTSAMPDANYAAVSASEAGGGSGNKGPYSQEYATTYVRLTFYDQNGSLVAAGVTSAIIVR